MQSPERQIVRSILAAYREGWFPMADPRRGVVEWVQPRRRGVIPLEPGGLRVSRSLRQRVRSRKFQVRGDTAFTEVVRACAEPAPGRDETWIDGSIIGAYGALHRAGYAHSVEAWLIDRDGERLVGGLYGVHHGAAFFGESMFARPALGGTDASKVCLVHLVCHLRSRGFTLLDTQLWNEHMGTLGCVEIPRREYLGRLSAAWGAEVAWGPFDAELALRTV